MQTGRHYFICNRGLLAPFRSIPEDILVEVFFHFKAECGKGYVLCQERRINIGDHRRLLTLQRCRYPHTSTMVKHFVVFRNFHQIDLEWIDLKDMVEIWLERAKSCLLSINIERVGDVVVESKPSG